MLWPEARRSPNVGIAARLRPLGRHPRHRTVGRRLVEAVQEAQTALKREARQRPRRGDDGQDVRGHACEGVGQHLNGVPLQEQRRAAAANAISASSLALSSTCSPTGAQPSRFVRVGHVDRVEVDADPYDDLGHRPRGDGPIPHERSRNLHWRRRISQRLPVAVGDPNAIDIQIEPSRTAHVNQPDRIRAHPVRRFGNGRIQHGATSGLLGRLPVLDGDGHNRLGHPQQRADRRFPGRVAVRSGIGGGKLRARPARTRSCSAARITVGCRFRAGAASMARNASSDSLNATATRSYNGDVPAASTSPNRRYTSASARPLPTGTS